MTAISSGAGISAAQKNAALAIQRTQSAIDQVQYRLATGKHVNSALDNPNVYFTANALSSRAVSLHKVLDGITEKLSTIKSASEAVTSLQELVADTKDIAESAQDELNSTAQVAKITGSRSLTNFSDLPADLSGVDNGDRLRFRFVDSTGSINSANSVVIANGDSSNDLVNNINAIVNTAAVQVFEASLNSSGQLTIKTANDTRFEIEFEDSGGTADTQLASALGFGSFTLSAKTDGADKTRVTVSPTPSLSSISLFAAGGSSTATLSTTLRNLSHTSGGAAGDIFNGDANDAIKISINGESSVTVTSALSTATVQQFIDGINDNGALNRKIKASFSSGEINIRAVDSDVQSIQIQLVEDGVAAGTAGKIDLQRLGFGVRVLQSGADGSSNISSESFQLGPSASALAALEEEYNTLRDQIDVLVTDSEFDDVNLLNGDDVETFFNQTVASLLTTEGGVFDSLGLGFSEANFGTSSSIDSAVTATEDATNTLENFSTALANDISTIETRETFTEETINTLLAGVEDLTAADENEDGAQLIALQTKLLLGVTALALGTQAQQSTLRLF